MGNICRRWLGYNGSDGALSSVLHSPHQFGLRESWLVSVGCCNMYDTLTHNYFDLSANSKATKTLSWEEAYKNLNVSKIWVIRRRWDCVCERFCVSNTWWLQHQPSPDRGGDEEWSCTKAHDLETEYMSFALPYTDLFSDPAQIT